MSTALIKEFSVSAFKSAVSNSGFTFEDIYKTYWKNILNILGKRMVTKMVVTLRWNGLRTMSFYLKFNAQSLLIMISKAKSTKV